MLICSDTDDGELAGRLVAASVGFPEAVVETTPDITDLARAVSVVRVTGLNPESPREFLDKGISSVAQLLRDVWSMGEGRPLHLHLSGGFKATLPFLVVLAEVLAALSSGPRPPGLGQVSASILWREATGGAIEVPIRQVDLDQLRDELTDPRYADRYAPRYDKLLYRSSDKRHTPLGTAVLELIDGAGAELADDG